MRGYRPRWAAFTRPPPMIRRWIHWCPCTGAAVGPRGRCARRAPPHVARCRRGSAPQVGDLAGHLGAEQFRHRRRDPRSSSADPLSARCRGPAPGPASTPVCWSAIIACTSWKCRSGSALRPSRRRRPTVERAAPSRPPARRCGPARGPATSSPPGSRDPRCRRSGVASGTRTSVKFTSDVQAPS